MVFIDIDGVLIDFVSTAKKFGIEIKANEYDKWKWGEPGFPAPEEFYEEAALQPWVDDLAFDKKFVIEMMRDRVGFAFITRDFKKLKREVLQRHGMRSDNRSYYRNVIIEEPDKSAYCVNPIDLLIDDNAAECEAWRAKGGLAWHFDLTSKTPFEDFMKFWRPRGW